jgi:CRP-like cAMP-binding protein
LRKLRLFEPFSPETLHFMMTFKTAEIQVAPGTPVLIEGTGSDHLYTVLRGMGVRFKTLETGARQVVNFVMPGDFLGLQAAVMGEMKHSVSATTAMTLCVFDRRNLWTLFRTEPQRAFDLTWLAAVEEHFLGEALASLGQRSGISRLAWALFKLWQRLQALGLGQDGAVPLPFRQQDLADALGLSLVHTNKSLQKLRQAKLLDWEQGRLTVHDVTRLSALAEVEPDLVQTRPLI